MLNRTTTQQKTGEVGGGDMHRDMIGKITPELGSIAAQFQELCKYDFLTTWEG